MRNAFKVVAASLALATLSSVGSAASQDIKMEDQWGDVRSRGKSDDVRLQWMTNDKYSMFIHWGLYSHMEGKWQGRTYYGIGEWLMHMAKMPIGQYMAKAKDFNPQKFDADAIVQLAKDAGMSCIVITAKHHEGFAMYDSAVSDFTIVKATPFKRDPLKELALACKKHDIRLGFYYSQNFDWTEPDGGMYKGPKVKGRKKSFQRYFDKKVIPQVTELLTQYGPVAQIWFDTPGRMPKKYSKALVNLVKKYQPDCLLNSRIGNGMGDFSTLGDMQVPLKGHEGIWESIDTTNDSWSYAWYDEHWKSPSDIAQELVRVVARGGLFRLNIGPKGDGSIPDAAVENLQIAGEWLKKNKEAIYGTEESPYHGFSWGDCTVKGNNLYLHLFSQPSNGELLLPSFKNSVKKATVLADGTPVTFSKQGEVLKLTIPQNISRQLITVLKLELNSKPEVFNNAHALDGTFPTNLYADFAEAKGAKVQETHWHEKFGEHKHSQNISGWKTLNDKATWPINVLKAGHYRVSVEYACGLDADLSEWQLDAEGDAINFVTMDSGYRTEQFGTKDTNGHAIKPRMRYQTLELGQITFSKTGLQKLVLKPRNKLKGYGIWLRRIILEPYL